MKLSLSKETVRGLSVKSTLRAGPLVVSGVWPPIPVPSGPVTGAKQNCGSQYGQGGGDHDKQ